MPRQRRQSRWIYILAAIGCAAGLGNLWRFPMLAFENGGAAFIVALLVSNLLIVFPLMMVETILGQKTQKSGPFALESLHKGRGWILWLPVFTLIFILMYYVPIMARSVSYLGHSFSGEFLSNPSGYFAETVIGLSSGITEWGGVQPGVIGALIVCLLVILASLYKGLKSVSNVLKITATAPFFLLIILVIRGVTLPGSSTGLEALFIPDWSQLLNIELWQAAVGQSFFSASLAFGYFVLMGSYREPKAELPFTSAWILGGNFLVSLLSGVAVFSTLGYMATSQGVPLQEAAIGGPMLIFSVLPTAISLMPLFTTGFVVLLFVVVITLAISSVLGMFETIVDTFHDSLRTYISNRSLLYILLGVIGLGTLPFMTGAGLYYLDIADHFIGGYLLMIIGALLSAVMAYEVGAERVRTWINATNSIKLGKRFTYLLRGIPVVLTIIFVRSFIRETLGKTFGSLFGLTSESLYGGYPASYIVGFGLVPLAIVFLGSYLCYRILQARK